MADTASRTNTLKQNSSDEGFFFCSNMTLMPISQPPTNPIVPRWTEDLALTIHAHPTLGELSAEAAEAAIGHPIHI